MSVGGGGGGGGNPMVPPPLNNSQCIVMSCMHLASYPGSLANINNIIVRGRKREPGIHCNVCAKC